MYEERRRKKRRKHTPKLARRLSPLISAGIYQIRLSGEGGKHEALFYHFFIPSFGGCCYCYFSDDRRKSVKNTYFDFCRKWNGWEKKKFPSNDMREILPRVSSRNLIKKPRHLMVFKVPTESNRELTTSCLSGMGQGMWDFYERLESCWKKGTFCTNFFFLLHISVSSAKLKAS